MDITCNVTIHGSYRFRFFLLQHVYVSVVTCIHLSRVGGNTRLSPTASIKVTPTHITRDTYYTHSKHIAGG